MAMRLCPNARTLGLALGMGVALAYGSPLSADAPVETPAPGYAPLGFKPPVPGTYRLSDLGEAGDARLIDSSGEVISLRQLIRHHLAVVSFIYTSCHETNGCPLATSVLQRTAQKLTEEPPLSLPLMFLTISFDPARDTPAVMARYGAGFQGQGLEWHFLTPQDADALQGLLSAYQQAIQPEVDGVGKKTGALSHVLRVFLIDADGHLRNSYTPSVLHPDLLAADLRTLALESPTKTSLPVQPDPSVPLRAGDQKNGYEAPGFSTQTQALGARKGRRADLIRLSKVSGFGLPKGRIRVTPEGVALGRKLFFDRRLSLNGTVSCGMCHIPEQGFASQEQATAVGIEGRTVRRNAPTVLNTGPLTRLFHDGREESLVNQVWGPLLAANEMGNPSVGFVLQTLRKQTDYQGLFEKAFGRGPSMETVGLALAQYEAALNAAASPFDQWFYGHKADALSLDAKKGFALFTGKAGCAACHTLKPEGSLLTDEGFHNTGIGYRQSMGDLADSADVQLAPGVRVNLDATVLKSVSKPAPSDLGRYEITLDPKDRWSYRTPGLRNVALTAPYMHNGSLASLEAVIDFYNQGGIANPGLDSALHPLQLTAEESQQLVRFLESLTGSMVNALVMDAWDQAVGDPLTGTEGVRQP